MKLILPTLLALSLVGPLASAQDPKPTSPGEIPPASLVPDIASHRVQPLPYVRDMSDIVDLTLPAFDIDDEVLFLIDKEPITREEFRQRTLMYLGMSEVEQEITKLITLQEIERRVAQEGADRAAFLPSESDIDIKIEELKEMVAMQARQSATDPDAGVETVGPVDPADDPGARAIAEFMASIESSVGMPKYRQMLGAESSFEKVFLPMPTEATGDELWDLANGPVPEDDPKPDWMPAITWSALSVDDSGRTLRQFVKSSASEGSEIPAFFRGQILTRIRTGVMNRIGASYFFQKTLPAGVFLRLGEGNLAVAEADLVAARNALAEGLGSAEEVAAAEALVASAKELVTDVRTDELWYLVKDQLVDTDEALILRELLTLRGMRRVLEAAGRWPDDDAYAAAFRAHEKEYEGTLFPLTAIIMFRGYDSLDRYREHYRYRNAYRTWREETMTEEELEEHYRAGGRLFFERGNVVVDAAYKGVGTLPFKDASFEQAENELVQGFARLGEPKEGGGTVAFLDVAAAFPKPVMRQVQGDDRTFQRNPLRMRLTESELSIFLSGYSLSDDMFYNGLPGEIFGPYRQRCRRHAWGAEVNAGVWMTQVVNYTRGRALAPMDGTNYDQARDDFLDLNYLYWSQECLRTILPRVKPAKES